MEFPPSKWKVLPADDFETAIPRAGSRSDGPDQAKWKSDEPLESGNRWLADLGRKGQPVFLHPTGLGLQVDTGQSATRSGGPTTSGIRRNMTTNDWADISDLIKANELTITDESKEAVENPWSWRPWPGSQTMTRTRPAGDGQSVPPRRTSWKSICKAYLDPSTGWPGSWASNGTVNPATSFSCNTLKTNLRPTPPPHTAASTSIKME